VACTWRRLGGFVAPSSWTTRRAPASSSGLRSSPAHPDVLVSDIGMPGTDGYRFLASVRELGSGRGGRAPAIALTAFARSEDRTRALRAGFLVHVSKPVDPSELAALVATSRA
jgi:CheY-like chemotaxis protein